MTIVAQLFPETSEVDSLELLRRSRFQASSLRPFDPEVIDFLNVLSQKLAKRARISPALAPLAFFMRKAAMTQLRDQAQRALPPQSIFVPQGLVFHIPPTNVDTLFLYTLALSLLAGNRNLVRISRNSGPETFEVLEIVFATLQEFPNISQLVTFVQFGHESDILETFSGICDVRMIWGGDATIRSVRKANLPVHGIDLAFPDRISLGAISVEQWLKSSDENKAKVIEGLYNDIYWFDQMACSSPQSIVLVGRGQESALKVKSELEERLSTLAQQRYDLAEGQAINKMVAAVRAVSQGAKHIDWQSNYSVVIDGLPLEAMDQIRPGGGFLGVTHLKDLTELSDWLNRKVQTLSVFGFSSTELIEFAQKVNGKGIDRIVPIGSALDFSDIWDGKNLLLEMLRLVRIES